MQPGKLWWGLDPEMAPHRGAPGTLELEAQAINCDLPKGVVDDRTKGAIVLLDEIDKADPDVPNDLLEPFDVGSFTIDWRPGTRSPGRRKNLALVLTTNGERELPQAFLRRCVTLSLEDEPSEDWLVTSTKRHGVAEPPYARRRARSDGMAQARPQREHPTTRDGGVPGRIQRVP